MTLDRAPDLLGQPDLWGKVENPYIKLLAKYGTWPITTWEVGAKDKAIEALVGDDGATREQRIEAWRGNYDIGASIFDPRIAEWCVRLWAPEPPALVYDPFAGGGTRAIVCTAHGLDYHGVELRGPECEALRGHLERAGNPGKARILQGDSCERGQLLDGEADFLLTCPPYYNLETYGGGAGDLSMLPTYSDFRARLTHCIIETHRVLKPGAFSIWVVGLHREKPSGVLIPLPQDNVRMHLQTGFDLMEEVILVRKGGGSIRRVGMFEKGGRHLVRTHEYIQVFRRR